MDAQKFLAEFGHIANAPNGIIKLRELVLQLAISGRLVEKSKSFQPVNMLINEANDLRKEYESSLKLRSTRMHAPLSKAPYFIPDHWKWERLERLCVYIQRGKGPKYVAQSSTYVVSQKCIQWSGFDLGPARYVADDSLDKYGKERFLCDGDLLWNSTGTGTAGRVAIYSTSEQASAVADSHVTVIRLANCSPRYFWCVIASPWVQLRIDPSHSNSLVSGTTQQVELNTTTVRALPIPVPPLEEQSRIVAKVDELMALCNQLEVQQQKRRTLQNQLRQASLQAVATSQSPQELQDSWKRLQANFGQLFSAPEDVVALKGLILDLALSGNLSDIEYRHHSTGAELLEAIAEKRIAWSNEAEDQEKKEAQSVLKKLRTQQLTLPEKNIPAHWAWASLLQVAQVIIDCDHKTPTYSDNGIHLIRTTDIRDGNMQLGSTKKVSLQSYLQRSKRLTPQPDDIFFTREAPMGEAAIVPTDHIVCLGQRLMLIRLFADLFNTRYLIYVIRSPEFQRRIQDSALGMTVKHINVRDVETLMLPVPPKSEQDAIVNKIDSLFGICNHLEKQMSNKQRIAENLVISSVATVTGISIEQEEDPMKAPKTELVALVRLGTPPDVKAQAPLATILARHNGEMSAKDLWQRFGGEIDAFYAQLKTEVAHGWILEPKPAEMREKLDS